MANGDPDLQIEQVLPLEDAGREDRAFLIGPGFWMPASIFRTLALAGSVACWLPARRALRIRPSEALSAD